MVITEFTGKYACFDMNYMVDVTFEGLPYKCPQSCFQSLKYKKVKSRNIYRTMAPRTAIMRGQKLKPLRPDWEKVKDDLMYRVIREKFYQNEKIWQVLDETGEEEIIFNNTFHDNYWGNCTCEKCVDIVGENRIGKDLMEARTWIRERRVKDAIKEERRQVRLAEYLAKKQAEEEEKARLQAEWEAAHPEEVARMKAEEEERQRQLLLNPPPKTKRQLRREEQERNIAAKAERRRLHAEKMKKRENMPQAVAKDIVFDRSILNE